MMKRLRRLTVLVAACTALSAEAPGQELGFGAALKMRAGAATSTPKDGLSRKMLGLGFEFTHDWTWGRLGLEVGYQYKPGSQRLSNPAAMPVAPGMTVDPSQSVDSRKGKADGIMGRLSFERPIVGTDFAWRVGVQFGGPKFRQEYLGDVSGGNYEDTYNGITEKTGKALSPLAGVAYRIDREQALELNVLWLNYTSANYVHVAGTNPGGVGGNTTWDYVETQKQTLPHIELCYVLRF